MPRRREHERPGVFPRASAPEARPGKCARPGTRLAELRETMTVPFVSARIYGSRRRDVEPFHVFFATCHRAIVRVLMRSWAVRGRASSPLLDFPERKGSTHDRPCP